MRSIRVILYGVGEIGKLAARQMIDKGIDVVAAINRPGPKVGKDLGILIGLGRRMGVIVSDDATAVLSKTRADIVFVATRDEMAPVFPIYVACIKHGLNVITVGSEPSFPWNSQPRMARELDRLAKKHGVTITGSGNQDLFMVHAATLASGACHRIDSIAHRSLTDVSKFGANVARLAYVGKTVGEYRRSRRQERAQEPSVYSFFWRNLAASLDLTICEAKQTTRPLTSDRKIWCDSLGISVPRGHLIGVVQTLKFKTREKILMRGDYELKLLEPSEREFKKWSFSGQPNLELEFSDLDTGYTTASQPVNRIPDVINSAPGYVTIENLPMLKYRHRALPLYLSPMSGDRPSPRPRRAVRRA